MNIITEHKQHREKCWDHCRKTHSDMAKIFHIHHISTPKDLLQTWVYVWVY